MKDAFELLRLLHEAFPPPRDQRHGILIFDGRPTVQLRTEPDGFQLLFLDPEDFEKAPSFIVEDIRKAIVR